MNFIQLTNKRILLFISLLIDTGNREDGLLFLVEIVQGLSFFVHVEYITGTIAL